MRILSPLAPLPQTLAPALQAEIDKKTKPLGALGKLEHIARQLGLLQQSLRPTLQQPTILVFAGDHGLAQAGVSAYPQVVTSQMVLNFLDGGAAINVFCRQHSIDLQIVDAGVAADLPEHPKLHAVKIAKGTKNVLAQPAMSEAQCLDAIEQGQQLVNALHTQGCNVVGFGEMGIANTSSASLLMHLCTKLPLEACVGRGTGLDDAQLAQKHETLQRVLGIHLDAHRPPLQQLSTFGGFEIAMMCGAMHEAARHKMLLLIDGFIVSAALLWVHQQCPTITEYCVFSHCSREQGHRQMLAHLGGAPLLDLELRLGEGTGAALAYPLVVSAQRFLHDMASFAEAKVLERDT